jgi:hypothetical protein
MGPRVEPLQQGRRAALGNTARCTQMALPFQETRRLSAGTTRHKLHTENARYVCPLARKLNVEERSISADLSRQFARRV